MNKQHLGRRFGVVVALCFLLIACVVAIVGYRAVKEQKLVKLQNSALEELERNKGTYDEQSIVLSSTSRAKAEELAELFNAELRITKDGRFARLTLPEGTNIRDIYANDDYRIYIEDMSADYEV